MLLQPETVEIIALAAAAVAVLALVVAIVSVSRLTRLRRSSALLQAGDDGASFIDAVNRKAAEVERLRGEVERSAAAVGTLRDDLQGAIRHVAVVRYDAFQDMGGRLSYSAALLDDAADGMVITAINGRQETRTYAKGIVGGDSENQLSPEEMEAIEIATSGRVAPDRPRATAGSRSSRRGKHAG